MPTRFIEGAHFESMTFRQLTEQVVCESTLRPEDVAISIQTAISRDELYCIVGKNERWYWRIKRLAPVTLLRRVARRVRKDLKSQESRVESREPE
jgi:hypothetical protein